MNERVKELRKSLGLTLEEFGNRIGIGKSAASKIERGRNGVSEQTIKSICREFDVNEEWLRTGAGSKFSQDDESTLDRLAKEYQMTVKERALIAAFLKLGGDGRAAILQYVDNLIAELYPSDAQISEQTTGTHMQINSLDAMTDDDIRAEPPAPEPDDDGVTLEIESQVERYRQQLLLESRMRTSEESIPAKTG